MPPDAVAVIVTDWPVFIVSVRGDIETVSGAPGVGVVTVMPIADESAVADALSVAFTQ